MAETEEPTEDDLDESQEGVALQDCHESGKGSGQAEKTGAKSQKLKGKRFKKLKRRNWEKMIQQSLKK